MQDGARTVGCFEASNPIEADCFRSERAVRDNGRVMDHSEDQRDRADKPRKRFDDVFTRVL